MTLARVVVDIAAPRQKVWNVLLAPDTPTKIMPVDEVLAPWRLGERFAWRFAFGLFKGLVERGPVLDKLGQTGESPRAP